MSNFKLQPIGKYEYTLNKAGKPMIRLNLDPKEVAKVKEWDMGKIYIYEPKKSGGDVLGLIQLTTE
jgi:hypothetical protein